MSDSHKKNENEKDEPKPTTGPKCEPNKHLKSSDLFCKTCKQTVCSKCLSAHGTHAVVDFEDLLNEVIEQSREFSGELKKGIEERLKEKEYSDQMFKEHVETYYEEQVSTITDFFKKLHDELYYKEVDLKRELKSFHEENCETLALLNSKIDEKIDKSRSFIQEIEEIQIDKENKENNIKMMSDFYETLDVVNAKTTLSTDFVLYKFYSAPDMANINTAMRLAKHKSKNFSVKGSASTKSPFNDNSVIYTYGKDGVEKWNSQTYATTFILKAGEPNTPPFMSFFWHYTVVNECLYMFDRDKYWILNCASENPTWNEKKFPDNNSSSVSTIYDGQDHIYILSGYSLSGKDETKSILKFNIHTEEFTKVGEKIVSSSYLSLSFHDDTIYLIGGYNQTNSWLNRIDKFNIVSNTIEPVTVCNDTAVLINSGVYVPTVNAYFVFTWTSNFYKYNPATNQYTKCAKPSCSANYTKCAWNGGDLIYLIVERDKNLHTYCISEDKFTTTPLGFQNEIQSSNFVGFSYE